MMACNCDFQYEYSKILVEMDMNRHWSIARNCVSNLCWFALICWKTKVAPNDFGQTRNDASTYFRTNKKNCITGSSKTKYSIASKSEADGETNGKWHFVLRIWKNIFQKCDPQYEKLTFGVIEMSLLWFWIDWRNAGSKILREQLDSVFTNIFRLLKVNFGSISMCLSLKRSRLPDSSNNHNDIQMVFGKSDRLPCTPSVYFNMREINGRIESRRR